MIQTTFSLVTFEYFLLILVRITAFMFVAPFFSMDGVPNMTKIGLAGIVSIMVVSVLHPEEAVYSSVIGYGLLVVKELACGILIGFAASICNSIVLFAGNVIDMDIGLSMVSEFDPTLNMQTTVTGQLYYYFMLLLLLVSDMHTYILRAVIDSFTLIPLGGAEFDVNSLLTTFITYFTDMFSIAIRIMLPVMACMLITNCVLGIIAKVAPQMNMFSVGVQIKILVGFAVMFVVIFLFPRVIGYIATEMKTMIVSMIRGMY